MKRAAKKKECRAFTVNSRRQQRGGAPAAADHGQGQGQPEGGKRKPEKKHHHQGHNSYDTITAAAPGTNSKERLL